MPYVKPSRSETIFLHLRPGYFPDELSVVKMEKSEDSKIEPGDVIVKAKITVPGNFFDEARPYVEIEFLPGQEIQPASVTITTEEN